MLLITGKHKKALQEAMGADNKSVVRELFVDKILENSEFQKKIRSLLEPSSYGGLGVRESIESRIENRIIETCVQEYLDNHKDKLFEKLSKKTLDTLILNRIVDKLVQPKSEEVDKYR